LTDSACQHRTGIVRRRGSLRDVYPLESQLVRQFVFEPIGRWLGGHLDPHDAALARLRKQTADRRAADAKLLRDFFLRSILDVVQVGGGDDQRAVARLRPWSGHAMCWAGCTRRS
jgi:hypothetical protein